MGTLIESVDLGKRAEAYAKFAFFCIDNQISGRRTAECIELCIQANRKRGYHKYHSLQRQVEERLKNSGATDINFYEDEGWPTFASPTTGDRITLPFKEFI